MLLCSSSFEPRLLRITLTAADLLGGTQPRHPKLLTILGRTSEVLWQSMQAICKARRPHLGGSCPHFQVSGNSGPRHFAHLLTEPMVLYENIEKEFD